jgi:non-heme chloroperoxidase
MKRIILLTFILILNSVIIYFGIAAVLILTGKPAKPVQSQTNLAFQELFVDYTGIPQLKTFTARDGKQLPYRYYPTRISGSSNKILILIHGSGWHSRYFYPLAKYLSSQNLAEVYTPDLRGHGYTPERRGDIDYIGQYEDDLVDFIAMIRKYHPKVTIIIGGHSSGGGLVQRFAGSKYGKLADAYILLAPYLQYSAPTVRPNSGGWANLNTKRIIGLAMLNNVGISWFNALPVISFNMPVEARNGTETLVYSYRLVTSFGSSNYQRDLAAINKPLLVVAGTADEVNYAEKFKPVILQYTKAQVELLPGVTHMGVVVGPEVRPVIGEWLKKF